MMHRDFMVPWVQIFGLALASLLISTASATGFTIVAVGAFGEHLSNCRVDKFRLSNADPGTRNEYKDSFRGLIASNLPDGDYEVAIRCREAQIGTYVRVNEYDRFQVVSENRRIMRSDHLIPELVVRMNGAHPQGGTSWVTLRALYEKRIYTEEFQSETGEAKVADPEPGSYLVSVLSTSGYSCLREIDLVESTRLWTFDPASCTFHVDAFAHLVTDEDKRALKTTSWYQQLRKRDEEFFRALENGVKDTADPVSKK